MRNPYPLMRPNETPTFACELVCRDGGGTTSRGLTPLEALADAFQFAQTKPKGTYVYISDPYRIFESKRNPGSWDTTPPEEVRAHRDRWAKKGKNSDQ